MIKLVYDDEVLILNAVFKWHKHLIQGRDSLEDDEQTGWPTTVRTEPKIEEIATLVRTNLSAVGINHDTCYKILSDDLSMSRNIQSVRKFLTQTSRACRGD